VEILLDFEFWEIYQGNINSFEKIKSLGISSQAYWQHCAVKNTRIIKFLVHKQIRKWFFISKPQNFICSLERAIWIRRCKNVRSLEMTFRRTCHPAAKEQAATLVINEC
jgi:hypothetical protein